MTEQFTVDFHAEKLGRAHQMRFGAYSLYGKSAKAETAADQVAMNK